MIKLGRTISKATLEKRIDEINNRYNKKFYMENKTGYTKRLFLRLENGEDRLIFGEVDRQVMWVLLKGLEKGIESGNSS